MKFNLYVALAAVVAALIIGYALGLRKQSEGFSDCAVDNDEDLCPRCEMKTPCGCPKRGPSGSDGSNGQACPPCHEPDPSKWVLKSTVPPCPPMPDMSKYMLKTECPPQPDMSKYTLKSSVPNCPPCISTCSKPCKIGDCPPCPRPRCPVVQCPEPKACPACPAAMCAPCPEPNIKCKAAYEPRDPVRPMLASTSTFGF